MEPMWSAALVRLSGLGGEPLTIVRSPHEPDPEYEVLPKAFALQYLEHWVADPIERQRLLDLHARLFGGLGAAPWGADDTARILRTVFSEAFEQGDLLVLAERRTGAPPFVRPQIPVGPPPPRRPPPLTLKTFVEFELLDTNGLPVPGAAYRVTLPDGTIRTGALDAQGLVRFDGIDPGECDIEFGQIDGREWE